MLEPSASFTVNGKAITKGKCAVCGSVMSKLGMTDAHMSLEKPVVQSAPKSNIRSRTKIRGCYARCEGPARPMKSLQLKAQRNECAKNCGEVWITKKRSKGPEV